MIKIKSLKNYIKNSQLLLIENLMRSILDILLQKQAASE